MTRAYELGKALATIGGSAAGGLVPALGMDWAYDSVDYFKDHWWAYPLLMFLAGGLLTWKGTEWMKPIGYGLVGAAFFQGYRAYKEEASGMGNVMLGYGRDAGNVMLPGGYRDAGALPFANPYAQHYQQQGAGAYPYAA